MKDRQAQLEQNIVAENLAGFFKTIEPYSKLILAAVVAIVVAFIGIGWYSSGQTAKRSDATLSLLVSDPDVATKYPNTPAAAWSILFQANDKLAQGIDALYQDRDEAETLLSEAKNQFIDARAATDEALLVSRASYGLALAAESLGETDDAIAAYKRVVEANESKEMVEVAEERIDRLSDPDTSDFLAWFSEQDFSPADPSLPPELPGASSLPDLPDLELPSLNLGDEMKASEEPAGTIEGGLELPETTTEPAASESSDKSVGESAAGEPKADAEPVSSDPSAAEASTEEKTTAGDQSSAE
ncbi:MAG: tetratricopeptide repeat protein [Planctomycetales bacterium]|nr:tetratricopeptide repeat protein [Planctomycetales bacterium]